MELRKSYLTPLGPARRPYRGRVHAFRKACTFSSGLSASESALEANGEEGGGGGGVRFARTGRPDRDAEMNGLDVPKWTSATGRGSQGCSVITASIADYWWARAAAEGREVVLIVPLNQILDRGASRARSCSGGVLARSIRLSQVS